MVSTPTASTSPPAAPCSGCWATLGAIPTVSIDYRTYEAQGWTIDATTDGTRFTNNRTGHGMFVSIEKVDTF
ncbi:lipoprotein [Mycobacterium tuberculosis]|nr:lipoprotein [Mycobacterium tuberculosis]